MRRADDVVKVHSASRNDSPVKASGISLGKPHSRARTGSGVWTAVVILMALLSLLLPIGVYPADGKFSLATALAALLAGLSGIVLAFTLCCRPSQYARFFFHLFVYVWFGLAAIVQTSLDVYYWPGAYSSGEAAAALFLTLLAVIAFESLYLTRSNIRRAADSDKPCVAYREIRSSRLLLLILGAVILTVALLPFVGGVESLLSSRIGLSRALSERLQGSAARGVVRWFTTIPLAAISYWLLLRWKYLPRSARKYAGPVVAVAILLNSPFSSTRAWLGTFLFALGYAIVERTGKVSLRRWLLIASLVGLIVAFPAANLLRSSNLERSPLSPERFLGGDYDALQQTMNGIRYVDAHGHAFGRQLAGPLVFFVPREAWSAKPVNTGLLVAEHSGYDYTNLSSPIWLEAYVDFGITGSVLIGVLMGLGARAVDQKAESRRTRSIVWVALPFLVAYQIVAIRGPLLAAMPPLVVVSFTLVIVDRFSRIRLSRPGSTDSRETRHW